MQTKTAKTARSKRKGQKVPDPRFAAFARLLARDLAQKHFEKELKTGKSCGYDSDTLLKDTS